MRRTEHVSASPEQHPPFSISNPMFTAKISTTFDDAATQLTPLCIGKATKSTNPSPDRVVTVCENDQPILRVDVYAYGLDCFAFEEALIWHDLLIVGFGSHVHTVSLKDRTTQTIALGSYFGHLYPHPDYLLIASGERIFRMQPDRSILWKSEKVGIDGVVVHEVRLTTIHGEGEWDPPGGWKPFTISSLNGGN